MTTIFAYLTTRLHILQRCLWIWWRHGTFLYVSSLVLRHLQKLPPPNRLLSSMKWSKNTEPIFRCLGGYIPILVTLWSSFGSSTCAASNCLFSCASAVLPSRVSLSSLRCFFYFLVAKIQQFSKNCSFFTSFSIDYPRIVHYLMSLRYHRDA